MPDGTDLVDVATYQRSHAEQNCYENTGTALYMVLINCGSSIALPIGQGKKMI